MRTESDSAAEVPQLRPGATANGAEADQRQYLLALGNGISQKLGHFAHPLGLRHHRTSPEIDGAKVVDGNAMMRQVFRDMDVNRARAAVEGQVDRLLDDVAGLGRIRQQE